MVWGVLIALWGTATFATVPDPQKCSTYLELLDLQSRTHTAEIRSKEAGITPEARAYWEREFLELHEQLSAFRKAVLEDSSARPKRKSEPGGTHHLEAASTEFLDYYHSTRPAGKPGGTKVVRVSDDGERMLVIPQRSFEFHLWDVRKNTFWILKMEAQIADAAFDWNGNALALDGAGNLALFAADGRRLGSSLPNQKTDQIALSSKQLLRLSDDMRLTHELTYSRETVLKLPPVEEAHILRVSSDARLAAISVNQTVHIIDLVNQARLKTFPEFNPSDLVALEFAPESHRLVGLGEDGALSVWDPEAIAVVTTLQLEHFDGRCLALDGQGNAFVGGAQNGGLNGAVLVVDLDAGEELRRFNPEHPGGVGGIALSPNGKTLVTTAAESEEIRFHNNPFREP